MTPHSPLAWLRWLIEPQASMHESERRRARLLAWIQLALLALAATAVPVALILSPPNNSARGDIILLLAGYAVVLAAAYALNRAGRYHASARLTILTTAVVPWVAVALAQSVATGDLIPLTFVVVPLFLAGILLSPPATALLAAIQITLLILIKSLTPSPASSNWASLVTLVVFISVLSVVAAAVNRQDMAQIQYQALLLRDSEAGLREQSVRDVLTGLFNRRYLEETLGRELHRAARAQYPLGVMMIDIDHFKRFNDTYGHALGDAVLRQLGALLRANIRGSDIACRYGGEEFIMILPEATLETTRQRAEAIRAGATRLTLQHAGQRVAPFTLSIGLAEFPQDGATDTALLKRADDALYQAKHEGRDQIA